MNNDKPLSERAYIPKQYAQRTVKNETRKTQIPSPQAEKVASGGASALLKAQHNTPPDDGRGKPYKHCRTLWFAPQTGHWYCGAFLYSSLRLLPIYVRGCPKSKEILTASAKNFRKERKDLISSSFLIASFAKNPCVLCGKRLFRQPQNN